MPEKYKQIKYLVNGRQILVPMKNIDGKFSFKRVLIRHIPYGYIYYFHLKDMKFYFKNNFNYLKIQEVNYDG